ncbi:Proline-rich protein PRCC [Taenia crassiceps]|uniref:Proline-rich protein PRCC n=1 Tax=Taenia crassiceps TaxID=6207 RepID=A0ABR4Q8Q6_9CEST
MALVDYDGSDTSDFDSENEPILEKDSMQSQRSFRKQLDFHDKVEDEYKMRMPKNAKPFLEPLNIERKSGVNGKVILTIPTVEELNSSDDSDDAEVVKRPSRKPVGSSSHKSLLDLLPPTRALIVKEGDKPIIPALLVPKQAFRNIPPKPAPPKSPKTAELSAEVGDMEVDVTSPGGFFTFNSTQEDSVTPLTTEEARRRARESILAAEAEVAVKAMSQEPVPSLQELPPLKEKPFSDWQLPKRPRVEREGDASGEEEGEEAEEEMGPLFTAETFIPGPERKRARLGRSGASAMSVADLLAASGGAKVREVRADDLTAGASLELLKNITTARPKMEPQQHLVNNPGKLAFRKHQITWLAYKAQEQEYELQEQWAEARRNQAQSRQKYGF